MRLPYVFAPDPPVLEMYRFCAASTATPATEMMLAFVIDIDGVLALLNGRVNRLTLLLNPVANKSPAAVNATWPTFPNAPLWNVADGVLEPDSGAGKNVSVPPSAPAARSPFASMPSATTLLDAIVKFGVELALM